MKKHKEDSFELARRKMLEGLKKGAKGKFFTKIIPFTNDDVPKFLRKLKKFESESRKANILVNG